jgi:His-Xaa-Ser system protein HxsD
MEQDQEASSDGLVIAFASEVFALDAIKRAAYKFTDRFAFSFSPCATEIVCNIKKLRPDESCDLVDFEKRFRIEVLDQDLRLAIAAETAPVRNVILAYAFSNTGLQESSE